MSSPSRFTTSDGLTLAFDDRGSGPVLLCLAGLTRNMGDFETILPLAGRCRLIRMDYRGRGQSDWAADPLSYSVPREAADALELLDHLGIDRAAILGTSRGGLIAMGLAATARHRLTGVLLNDIGPEIDAGGLARIMGYVGMPVAPRTLDDMAALLAASLRDFPGVTAARWREAARHWYHETEAGLELRYDPRLRDALIAMAEGGGLVDLWPFFDALAGLPLAALRGANSDLLTAATLAEMQRRRPDLIAATVPDRGHTPFLDEAESLAVLAAFLDRLEGPTE